MTVMIQICQSLHVFFKDYIMPSQLPIWSTDIVKKFNIRQVFVTGLNQPRAAQKPQALQVTLGNTFGLI